MWNVMVFSDETRSRLVKVMEFGTIKDAAKVLGMSPQCVSNFYHGLILPRHSLRFVAIFKA